MKSIKFTKQIGSRERRNYLVFRTEGRLHLFRTLDTLPKEVGLISMESTKNGKWSSTTYEFLATNDVTPFEIREGWESGTIIEATTSKYWVDLANFFQVGCGEVHKLFADNPEWHPEDARELDRREAILVKFQELEEQGGTDYEEVTISWGSPTNRSITAGFWEGGVEAIYSPSGKTEIVFKDDRLVEGSLCDLVQYQKVGGYHGGYRTLTMLVPSGTRLAWKYPLTPQTTTDNQGPFNPMIFPPLHLPKGE
jgi:hypothetical protein